MSNSGTVNSERLDGPTGARGQRLGHAVSEQLV